MAEDTLPASPIPAKPSSERLVSLDAYRGFVMLAMVSGGLGLTRVAERFPNCQVWQTIGYELEHVRWTGCSAWDLIQPSFMFIVGVAVPYSYASRRARGDSNGWIAFHVIWRALFLVALGIFLRSNGDPQTDYTFEDVATQIGLGYAFLYLVLGRGWRIQMAVLISILVGYWLLFALWPLPPADFDAAKHGIPPDWKQFEGFAAHWDKYLNPAGYFDQWFLNLFPRPEPFVVNNGGYQTLNFVPSLGTMILGVMAGEWLRTSRPLGRKVLGLILAGVVCLAAGMAVDGHIWPTVDWTWSVAPIVKRIWTPSWSVFSAGWVFLTLAAFIIIIDIAKFRSWAFPLLVVGMNSITMYVLSWTFKPWVQKTLKTHLGTEIFEKTYGPFLLASLSVLALWLVAFWMYRKRIFIRI